MKTKELKQIKQEDLLKRLKTKELELSNLKFELKTAQETDYSKVKKLKKEIARINTLMNLNNLDNKSNNQEEKIGKNHTKSDKITESK